MKNSLSVSEMFLVLIRLYNLLLRHKWLLIFGLIFMILFSFLNAYPALIINDIIESLEKDEEIEVSRFFLVGLGIVTIFALKGICYFWQNYLMNTLGQYLIMDMRNILFEKVLNLPLRFFDRYHSSKLMQRFSSDMILVNQAVSLAITGPIRDFPQIIFLLTIMLYRSWRLFVITALLIPPTVFLVNYFSRKARIITKKRMNKNDELSEIIQESVLGIRVVKSFGTEKIELERFRKMANNLLFYFKKNFLINSYSSPILEVIAAMFGVAMLTYGAYLLKNDFISTGELASFLLAFFMLNGPIKKFNGFGQRLVEGLVSAQRIFEICEEKNPMIENNSSVKIGKFSNKLEIKIDKFGYDKYTVLRDVNFEIEANQMVAFVGSSGSGKSTLVSLLPRFYELPPNQGRILMDGIDIQNVDIFSLRNNFSLVSQETLLFNETVRKNILYGAQGKSNEEIIQCARMAECEEFIEKLPEKYNTTIGEKGVLLSGGQKQRLAIARALMKDAPILILDEATSSLDDISEKAIQASLRKLYRKYTLVIIAHRLSTIVEADVIHMLKGGTIIESGSHFELMEYDGEYAKFYRSQTGKERS